jgi:hypothetical protein
MSLLLYGIVAENVTVVLEPELHLIKAAGLAAIVKVCTTEISRESAVVLAYGEKISQIHQQATLIPIRYGSVLANEANVIQHLQNHVSHYHARLLALADCEEMGIRLLLPITEDHLAKTSSGQAYLLARKRAYAVPESTEQQATLLNKELAGLYRQHCAELSLFNGQRTYLLSYLVSRSDLPAFRDCLHTLAEGIKQSRFISGPWPPYSFAN